MGERGDADRAACVPAACAEHFDEEIGASINHFRMFREFRHGVDEPCDFYDADDAM